MRPWETIRLYTFSRTDFRAYFQYNAPKSDASQMANMTPIFDSTSVLAMTAAVTGVLIEDAENVDGFTLSDHNEDIVVEVK